MRIPFLTGCATALALSIFIPLSGYAAEDEVTLQNGQESASSKALHANFSDEYHLGQVQWNIEAPAQGTVNYSITRNGQAIYEGTSTSRVNDFALIVNISDAEQAQSDAEIEQYIHIGAMTREQANKKPEINSTRPGDFGLILSGAPTNGKLLVLSRNEVFTQQGATVFPPADEDPVLMNQTRETSASLSPDETTATSDTLTTLSKVTFNKEAGYHANYNDGRVVYSIQNAATSLEPLTFEVYHNQTEKPFMQGEVQPGETKEGFARIFPNPEKGLVELNEMQANFNRVTPGGEAEAFHFDHLDAPTTLPGEFQLKLSSHGKTTGNGTLTLMTAQQVIFSLSEEGRAKFLQGAALEAQEEAKKAGKDDCVIC